MAKFYSEGTKTLVFVDIILVCCFSVIKIKGSFEWEAKAKHICSTRFTYWTSMSA